MVKCLRNIFAFSEVIFLNWDFNLPVKLAFGVGRHKELSAFIDEIGGQVGVLVCSRSFAKNGLADEFYETHKPNKE